jgi:OFA family oxalate/formate antiporter-like MFS transporter
MLTSATGSTFYMTVGLIAVGLCFGAGAPVATKYIFDRYGPKNYGKNFGLMIFCAIPASFIGPYVSGILQDRSGGDYESTFMLLLIMGIAAFLVYLLFVASLKREMRINAKKAEEALKQQEA